MRRVVVLVESHNHVCYRYRYAAFRDGLRSYGWALDPHVLKKTRSGQLTQFTRLRRADVVVIERKLLPAWQLFALRRFASSLVFDFDDAVLYHDSYSNKGVRSGKRQRLFAATLRTVDRVIAGNWYLAHLATAWCPRGRVERIPTCVDPGSLPYADPVRTEDVELCWIGSRSTAKSFVYGGPIFEALGGAIPGIRLRVISDCFPSFTHLPVIPHRWSVEGEAAALAACDIGVSWLPDDEWSRGKCGLKVLQYMAAGLPVVANPVGPHRELVEHEKTGFLAETVDDWRASVALLAANPALRRHMGMAGRRRVEEHYNVARWIAPLANCLDQAASGSRRSTQRSAASIPQGHFQRLQTIRTGRSTTQTAR
jgi:glycosyltransferase involved in cell wall biosynthesis